MLSSVSLSILLLFAPGLVSAAVYNGNHNAGEHHNAAQQIRSPSEAGSSSVMSSTSWDTIIPRAITTSHSASTQTHTSSTSTKRMSTTTKKSSTSTRKTASSTKTPSATAKVLTLAKSSTTSKKPSTTTTKKTTTTTIKKASTTTTKRTTTTTTKKASTKKTTTTTKNTSTKTTTKASATATSLSSEIGLAWKGGLSGFPGIESLDIFYDNWAPYISWYSNYYPVAPNVKASGHTVIGAPMLWGKGDQCLTGPDGPVDAWRLGNFTEYVVSGDTDPSVFFGFYEPDCDCNSSSHIVNVADGVSAWDKYIKPLSSRGIKLGSPPMCTQLDQTWLTTFNESVTWDITSIHVNKPTAAEGAEVVEYYYSKFGKPVWVSEFTCVDDQNWSSCGNQTVVNNFITEMVEYFESNPNVIAYGANNGEGVPGVWNLMTDSYPKQLTATGEHYLSVLKSLYG